MPVAIAPFFSCPRLGRGRFASFALILSSAVVSFLLTETATAQTQTADYEVIFEASWSETTHPVDFPVGSAHFSPLIGGTHDSNVVFWEPGGSASAGIKSMAETGKTAQLINEFAPEITAGFADQTFLGIGINSPGMTTLNFTVSQDHPQLTLVSMIAPSPDWFIGVHGLALFDQGWWVPEIVVELSAYDAGTDSGVTFRADNLATSPAEPIVLQVSPLEAGVPMGTFTIRRVPEPGFALSLVPALALMGAFGRRGVASA